MNRAHSNDRLKNKTKVIKTNNQSEGKFLKEPMRTQTKTRKLSKARENAGVQVAIRVSLVSDLFRINLSFKDHSLSNVR